MIKAPCEPRQGLIACAGNDDQRGAGGCDANDNNMLRSKNVGLKVVADVATFVMKM
ncbi:hypothetical protein ACLOJK_020178 [Asimina triloba]